MNYNFSVNIEKKQRVDMYLSALFWEVSRSYIQKLIDTWCVLVNGEKVKKNIKLVPRDEISIEEIITSSEILAEYIPLLVNALLYHCREKLPVISGEQRPGIVHRLDKNTSGVIVTAKNDIYMKDISEKIKNREVKKYYIAIVSWVLTEEKFTITSEIGRHPTDKIKMTVKNPLNPKQAVTHGEVLWYIDETYTVIKVDLETWRTHQIRVHLASIGYPIIWDDVYGNPKVNKRAATMYQVHRQALHAYEFHIFLNGEKKSFLAPLKSDMHSILEWKIELW